MSFLLNVVFQSAQLAVTIADSIVNGAQTVRNTIYIPAAIDGAGVGRCHEVLSRVCVYSAIGVELSMDVRKYGGPLQQKIMHGHEVISSSCMAKLHFTPPDVIRMFTCNRACLRLRRPCTSVC